MSNKIKELRDKMNMSQSEFANYLHIPVKNIQNWEQGSRIPPDYVTDMIQKTVEADVSAGVSKTAIENIKRIVLENQILLRDKLRKILSAFQDSFDK